MRTCGECIKNVGGRCQDKMPNGEPVNIKVSVELEACIAQYGYEGFRPKQNSVEVVCINCIRYNGALRPCNKGHTPVSDRDCCLIGFEPSPALSPKPQGPSYFAIKVVETKENDMNAIIRLADSQLNKQIEDFGGLSLDIREALESLQSEERKQAAQTAAKEVLNLLNSANASIEDSVSEINAARRLEKQARNRISEINRARVYGLETNNFVPLGILVGKIQPYQVDNEVLRKVPGDWVSSKDESSKDGK